MALFQLGTVIKARREELELSQEEVADGICSVPTLSRIENGDRMPTKNHLEMLMQRLGYSATSVDYYTDKQTFLVHELKFKTRQAYVAQQQDLARKYLAQLEAALEKPTNIDRQFLLLHQILLNRNKYSPEERLQKLEYALRLTCPKYTPEHIPKVLL